MFSFIVRRLGQAVAVVLLVTLIVFILLKVLPGGTARALLGPRASTSAIKTFNHANGFDRPVIIQYLNWIWKILHWNLGYSYKYNQPVSTLLGTVLPKSLLLVGMAMLLRSSPGRHGRTGYPRPTRSGDAHSHVDADHGSSLCSVYALINA